MKELKDDSIQLIITSPPYGKIKDYGSREQIGFYDTFEEYFLRLNQVWTECHRVLEPKCRMVINIGDQYLRTTKFERYRVLSIFSRIINHCLDIGFDYLGDIIWQKISTTNTTGGCSLMGSIYYPRNGLLTYDYEHILIFKKHQGSQKKIDTQRKELSKITLSEWKKWYIGHWRFPGIVQKEHVAMFPEELPYRIIRMFSFINDTILDPFVGSGTTLKVAKSLFRKGVGYEINKDYKPIIENKIKEGKIGYFKDYQFLVYILFQKAKKEKILINFKAQKQKGIIAFENVENNEIVLDYLLINAEKFSQDIVLRELELKLNENTIKNYLNGSNNWIRFTNYVIVINLGTHEYDGLMALANSYVKSLNTTKNIICISYPEIVSENFKIKGFFKK
jgi:site-specific DNA-methyltransferase (adenine-specific)